MKCLDFEGYRFKIKVATRSYFGKLLWWAEASTLMLGHQSII